MTTTDTPIIEDNRDKTQRPVAVYGTLREGQGNWAWAIQPYGIPARKAVIHNHAMYPMRGFPYVVPQEDAQVVVEIFDFPTESWEEALDKLDGLEGYNGEGRGNHYVRRVVTAITEDGEEVEVYTYIAADEAGTRKDLDYYPSGDWLTYQKETFSKSGDVVEIIHEIFDAQTQYQEALASLHERYNENAIEHAFALIQKHSEDTNTAELNMVDPEPDFDDYYDAELDGTLVNVDNEDTTSNRE